ncbi:hypothetical protein B296_00052770 [Ensete ventricosum]|uniref:Uncharacterized protein n=1 Tax=Ensete ventricosum TaxID=4639 RepID=A0A426XW96_ENSVE|nr:hypothetical protein B296_00052770 [Ensete ventricosum]
MNVNNQKQKNPRKDPRSGKTIKKKHLFDEIPKGSEYRRRNELGDGQKKREREREVWRMIGRRKNAQEVGGRKGSCVSGRTADLTQVRSTPQPVDASLTARTTGVVKAYDGRVSHKGDQVARYG